MKKGCTFAVANDASVAQLVEHLTLNQGVQGSTPCGSTAEKPLGFQRLFVYKYRLRFRFNPYFCCTKPSSSC